MMDRLYQGWALIAIISVVYLVAFLHFERWETNIISGGDTWGYYGYLPAAFIYGDLHNIDTTYKARFEYSGGTPHLPGPGGELPIAENGHRLIKYTTGVAIMQLPFFAVGHVWAKASSRYAADGYSFPYIICIHLANLFYLLIGAFLLFKIIAESTNKQTAFWTLFVLLAATNLYNFAIYRGPMAHSYLFALYCGLIYATDRIYKSPQWKWALLLGVCAGFITLIRPVEILCLAIPLLYGLTSKEAVQKRLAYWQTNGQKIVFTVIVFIICGLPQLFYWKYASGHWYFDSYPGEAFDFTNAKIAGGLFSAQNGMFVYSPILLLAVLGLWQLRKHKDWLWPIVAIIPLHIWIAYSWWNWYYINGFGSRPMVEVYALLAFPLAYAIAYLLKGQKSKWLLGLIILGGASLQWFQNWQHGKGVLWPEMANSAYYWSVFGKTEMTYDALVAFDSEEMQPDSTDLTLVKKLAANNFEQPDTLLNRVEAPVFEGQFSVALSPEKKYLEVYNETIDDTELKPGQWVYVSAWCRKEVKEFPWYIAPAIVVNTVRDGQNLKYRQVRIDSKLGNPRHSLWGGQPNTWGFVRMWYQLPKEVLPTDRLKIFLVTERQTVFIDEINVQNWQ